MKEKLVRLWGSYDEKKGSKIRKEVFEYTNPPEEMEEIEDHVFYTRGEGVSGLTKTWLNKVRPIVVTEKLMSFECWCEENRAEEFIEVVANKMEMQLKAILNVYEIRKKRIEETLDKGYELEIK